MRQRTLAGEVQSLEGERPSTAASNFMRWAEAPRWAPPREGLPCAYPYAFAADLTPAGAQLGAARNWTELQVPALPDR